MKKLQIIRSSPEYKKLVEFYKNEKNAKLKVGYHALVLIKYITIDYTMSTDLEVIKEKLDKGYYGKDTHLLIVLYNKDRASLARSWDRQIQGFITDYPGHVNVITIEDLSRFLDLDKASNEELNGLMYSKRLALSGNEDNFNNLKEQRDSKLISLHQMKVTQYWFDKYIGSK